MSLEPELLFDCPEPLSQIFEIGSRESEALRLFGEVARSCRGRIVKFVTNQEYAALIEGLDRTKMRTAHASVRRLGEHLVGDCDRSMPATPIGGPPDLSEAWKCALGSKLAKPEAWRIPQIVTGRYREAHWPAAEEIEIESGPLALSPARRVLAVLESYATHSFALSDFDPWDLRHVHPLSRNAGPQHPCLLPKPPLLDGLTLPEILAALPHAWGAGWEVNGRYVFLPPRGWEADAILRDSWRRGYAFEHGLRNGRSGHVDMNANPWCWDAYERHWDVQFANGMHLRISHEGRRL